MTRGFYLGGNMKKFTGLVVVLIILIATVFFVFNMNKKNDLYITFNINKEIYALDITPVFSLKNLENQEEQQIIVNEDMNSAVFDGLKNGDYQVSLLLENMIYETKEISVENNEFFKQTQKHSIAFLVDVPRKINNFDLFIKQNKPEFEWESEGSVVPEDFILSFGDRKINLSGEKRGYQLTQDDLDYIYSNDVKTAILQVLKADNILDTKTISMISVLYHVDFKITHETGKQLSFYEDMPFVSEKYKSRIFVDEVLLSTLSNDAFFNADLGELLSYLKKDNSITFRIITEYNNFMFAEKTFDVPVYVNTVDIKSVYGFNGDLAISNSSSDTITMIYADKLVIYSFKQLDSAALSLSYKGKEVFNSELSYNERSINLFDLEELKIENIKVNDSRIFLVFNQDKSAENRIMPDLLEINNNDVINRLNFATMVILEKMDEEDVNLKVTPVYFDDLESTPLKITAKRHELQFEFSDLLLHENLSVKVNSEVYPLIGNSVVFYDTNDTESVLVSVDYDKNTLYEVKCDLSNEKKEKINLPDFENVEISDIVFSEKNVDLLLTGTSSTTTVTFKPEYYYLKCNGTKTRFDTPVISFENVREAGEYVIIPVYKNNIEGSEILYRKPVRLEVDLDYKDTTLNENDEITLFVYPVYSDYEYNVMEMVEGAYIDIEAKETGEKLTVPLNRIGSNLFKIVIKDEYNQTISRDVEIKRLNSPEINLEEFNFINGKLYARWTEDPFYDFYTVTYSYDDEAVETKLATGNTIEINDVKQKLSVSVSGNHEGLTRVCFDTTIDVSDYVQNSIISNYTTEKTGDNELGLFVKFNNQNSLNILDIKMINSSNELIEEKLFIKSELNKFGDGEIMSLWNVIPGETYHMVFDYEYIYDREEKELHFTNQEKSVEIYAERPEKLEIKSLYQNDKNNYFIQTNDFGKNIIYIFNISNGEIVVSLESESNVNNLSLGDFFANYIGKLNINIQIINKLSGEMIIETNNEIEKIDADIYLHGSLEKNRAYLSKTVCVTDIVSVSTDVLQKFYNCNIIFNKGAYIDLFYSTLEIIDSTITTFEGQNSEKLNNDGYLMELENSSLKITGTNVKNMEKFVLSNFNSHVMMENCVFFNVSYPIESLRSYINLSYITAYDGIRFMDSIYDQNISVKSSKFFKMTSGFLVANCELLEFNDVRFGDIQTEGIYVYDSNLVNLNHSTFEDNRIALKANNITLSMIDTDISDFLYGLVLQNTDFKADNITIKNGKDGIYLYNCFSQLINSYIESGEKGIFYNNELFKNPSDIMSNINFADIESIQKNDVVSLIMDTNIKSEVAIHISSGPYNVVYKGLPPNGRMIHGGISTNSTVNNQAIGRVIYLKQGENLNMNFDFAAGEENISAPTIPISKILNIIPSENGTETETNIDAPEEIINKYKN